MDISRRPPGPCSDPALPMEACGRRDKANSNSTIGWIKSLAIFFLHFPLLSIHTRRSNNVHGNPPLFYLGKLFVGFQLQDTSGCLSPSVTGQAFSGIEGSATHPGSSLRQPPSLVGEGRTLEDKEFQILQILRYAFALYPLLFRSFWGIPFCLR